MIPLIKRVLVENRLKSIHAYIYIYSDINLYAQTPKRPTFTVTSHQLHGISNKPQLWIFIQQHVHSSKQRKQMTGTPLQWRRNERDGVLNHRRLHFLFNCWFRRRSNKTSKLYFTGHYAGNSSLTGEFPVHKARNAGTYVSIWWRHHFMVVLAGGQWYEKHFPVMMSSWGYGALRLFLLRSHIPTFQ